MTPTERGVRKKLAVRFQSTRIRGKVLMRSKLLGVHENASHDEVVVLASLFSHDEPQSYLLDETNVALMKRSPGRDEADRGEAVILLEELGHNLVTELSHSLNTSETTESQQDARTHIGMLIERRIEKGDGSSSSPILPLLPANLTRMATDREEYPR